MTPTQVFDNLYFVGNLVDSSWALQTKEGLIVFDPMFDYEVEPSLIAGLEKLGLDPADIRYVVLAHGHADHFGGAALLQERYGAQVIMSNTEWHYLYDTQSGGSAPLPERDITVPDGDTLILGDTTVRFVNTPSHTPGTISSVFSVRDGDQSYKAALWGGTAMNFLDNDDIRVHRR
jgi:metallo-beta-lactamase class B